MQRISETHFLESFECCDSLRIAAVIWEMQRLISVMLKSKTLGLVQTGNSAALFASFFDLSLQTSTWSKAGPKSNEIHPKYAGYASIFAFYPGCKSRHALNHSKNAKAEKKPPSCLKQMDWQEKCHNPPPETFRGTGSRNNISLLPSPNAEELPVSWKNTPKKAEKCFSEGVSQVAYTVI